MHNDRIMTTKEIADYIRLNEKTVIRMAQNGKLPGSKVGKQWRFRLSDVDVYLQNEIIPASDRDLDLLIRTTENIILLSRLTGKNLMVLNLDVKNGDGVLAELANLAYKNGVTSSERNLLKELKTREKMLSTAINNRVAIPHPRHPSLKLFKRSKIIIARSERGVDYAAPDKKPVRIFFMVCAQNNFIHLRLLAKISKLLHAPDVIDNFMKAKNKDEITRILLEFDKTRLFPKSRD